MTSGDPGRKAGKPRPGLLPWRGMAAVLRVGEFGSQKHDNYRGWEEVPIADYEEALKRHALEVMDYEDTYAVDPESGELHLAHIAWNCLRLLAALEASDE